MDDKSLAKLAEMYVEEDGRRLIDEHNRLENEMVNSRSRRSYKYITTAASLVLLLVSISVIFVMFGSLDKTDNSPQLEESVYDSEIANSIDNIDSADGDEFKDGNASVSTLYVPLAVKLPVHLTVGEMEMDEAKTVYSLKNDSRDDVVLVMEQLIYVDELDVGGLKTFEVNGVEVFYENSADFRFMCFDYDGVRYSMTCKYEIETLEEFTRFIL